MAFDLFKSPDREGTASQLADHMPIGDVWAAKNVNGSNLRALVSACGVPFNFVQAKIEEMQREFNIDTSTLLLPEWETSVGIPDCVDVSGQTLTQRRNAVKRRLRKAPIVTLQEMQDYVDSLIDDVTVTLIDGHSYYSLPYQLPQPLLGDVNAKFILVAEIPISSSTLPYQLPQQLIRGADLTLVRCLIERVIPANVYLDIKEVVQ